MGLWDGLKTNETVKKPSTPAGGLWSGLNTSTSSPTQKVPEVSTPAPYTGLWSGLQYTPPKQSSPELSPTYPQPTEKPQEQGVFSKFKGFLGGLFGKDSEKSNAAPQLNVPETPKAPEIKPPEGAKIGDVFTAADGKQYKVVPPALESYLPGKMTNLTVAPVSTAVSQTTPIAADKGTAKQVSDALAQIKKENENITFGEFVKSVPDAFAEIVGRPQLRAYGAVGGTVAKRLGLSEQDYTPLSKFERDVFGSENPLTLTSVGRETRGADKAGESKGVFKYADPAVGLIVGSLDALDGGTLGRLSKILRASKEAKVAISQSTDAAEIAGILRREIPDLTDNLAKAFAEPLRYIDNADEVEKVLNRTKYQLQEINKANGFNEPMQLAGEIKNVASDIESLTITSLQKNALQALREGYVTNEVVDVLKTIDPGVLDRVPVKSGSVKEAEGKYKSAEELIKEVNSNGVSIPNGVKKEMKGQDFSLQKVSIDEIINNDPDVKGFVENYKGKGKTEIKNPIIIGEWQGNKNAVMDGWHRLASLKKAGVQEVDAYISRRSQFTDKKQNQSFEKNDIIKITDKATGQSQERIVESVADDYVVVNQVDRVGIPNKASFSKWDVSLIKKGTPDGEPQFKVGDTFIDKNDGQKMTIKKVLPANKNSGNKYVVDDKEGLEITLSEKYFNEKTIKQENDITSTSYKKGVGEGVQIPKEEADKLIRQFFNDSDIKVLFTKNMIDDVAIGKASFRKDMYSGKVGTIIKMVEQNGTVDDVTAYHESFHGFFHLYVPSGQRKVILNSIKRNIFTAPGRGLKYLEGYKGSADERAEEWLADDFADFIKNQKEYKGQNRSIFQRLLEKIRQWIRKISKVQEVYDRMLEKKARVNVAKKETTSAMKRGKKEPSEYTTMQEAIQERKKVLFKENEVNRFSKQEQEIGQLLYQRDSLQEFLDSNPAKELSKYANSNGELPEVIGSGPGDLSKTGATSKFGKSGDDIVASLGYEDSESARAAYSKYLDDKNRLTSLNQEIKSKKEALSKEKLTYKEEKILARLAEKGDKKTAELVQKEKSKADKIKEMEQTQEKLKAEEEVRRTLGEKIAAAQREEVRSKGFFAKIRQMLKPIQALDPKTKEIVETWAEDKILAKVAGQETWLEMRSKGPQTMEEVHEYEAGKNTPYIRYALDDLYDQAKAAGLEFEYKGDYLPHVYAQGPKQVAKAMVSYLKDRGLPDEEIAQYMAGTPLNKDKAARLKINPNFIKERTFPTYKAAEGYGLTPRFRTPAQLIGHYKEALETAIANRNLVKKLKSEAKLLDADDAPDSWDPVTTRFTARERLYARPELAELLNGKFRDEENLGVGQRILKGFGAVSKFMQEVTLSAGVPFTNINYFSIGQAIKLLATAMGETTSLQFKEAATSLKSAFSFVRANSNTMSAKWFHENKAYIARAAMEGMDISENIGDYKVVHQRFQDLLPNLSVEDGIFGKAKAVAVSGKNIFSNFFNQAFNEKTFGSMMAQINLQIFKDNYDLMVSKGFTDKEAAKFAADTTKAFMGLTGETGRGKTTEDALSSIFFAPRFREGLINVFTQAFKGTTTEFRNKAYAKNRAFLAGMVITFALYQYLNQKTSGQYTWENPSGRQFAIRIPLPDGSIGYVEFMPSILAFPRNMSEGALALLDSDWSTAGQKFGTIFSMPLKLVTEIFSNSDYFGRQIFNPDATTAEKSKDIAKYIGLGVNHPFIKETVKYIQGDQPFYQALTYMLELPMKFSTQTKEDTGAYYNMLDDQNKKRKQAKDDVKKIYDRLQEMKSEGQVQEANDIYFGLSEGQRYLYDQIKSDEKRKATNARKPKIQKVYNQLQDLKEAGRTEEANAIYYGLSDSDRKIYDSIKKAAKINAALDE